MSRPSQQRCFWLSALYVTDEGRTVIFSAWLFLFQCYRLPWPILGLTWNVTCEWPPELTKQREVTTHTSILNSMSSPWIQGALFYYTIFPLWAFIQNLIDGHEWITSIFVCLRLLTWGILLSFNNKTTCGSSNCDRRSAQLCHLPRPSS